MNFASYAFLALFAIVLASRFLLGPRKTEPGYVGVLLGASLVFYLWHIPAFLTILLASAIVDFVAGLSLGPPQADARVPVARTPVARRAVLVASLATNLGLLAFFKYAGFFETTVTSLAAHAGYAVPDSGLSVLLPMGISFYTFQSMSYTIDVYRGRLEPIRRFAPFLLFISFFPQLVAGPIVRASEFLPQLRRMRRIRAVVAGEGAFLVVSGYFLKVVCADNLGTYVDTYWDLGYQEGAGSLLLLSLAVMFAAQIFCDFAGYSSIARGLAYLLGFRLPINFDAPYLAASFKNFWERWHITLSRWLRDYLYVPLGGNRVSPRRTYVNLLLVMLLGGLWHGAAWTFVVWGAMHGTALAAERLIGLHQEGGGRRPFLARAAWFLVVQLVVLCTWVFFRSETIGGGWQFMQNIMALRLDGVPARVAVGFLFVLPVVLMHGWTWLVERGTCRPLGPAGRALLAGLMLAFLATAYGSTAEFIYFQF